MGILMDLVAGDAREILLAIGMDDWAGLRDPRASPPTSRWAAEWTRRGSTCSARPRAKPPAATHRPRSATASTRWTAGSPAPSDRTVERVDPALGRRRRAAAGGSPGPHRGPLDRPDRLRGMLRRPGREADAARAGGRPRRLLPPRRGRRGRPLRLVDLGSSDFAMRAAASSAGRHERLSIPASTRPGRRGPRSARPGRRGSSWGERRRPGLRRPFAAVLSMSWSPSAASLSSAAWMSGTSKQTWWNPSPLASRNLAAPVVSSSG